MESGTALGQRVARRRQPPEGGGHERGIQTGDVHVITPTGLFVGCKNQNNDDLDSMAAAWREAKDRENQARTERLKIEQEILAHSDLPKLKPDGINSIGRLRILTGFHRKWDQNHLFNVMPLVPVHLWPFEIEYKEIFKSSASLCANEPAYWSIISPGLSLKKRQPSIQVTPQGE